MPRTEECQKEKLNEIIPRNRAQRWKLLQKDKSNKRREASPKTRRKI